MLDFTVLMSLYINSEESHFRVAYNSILEQSFLPNQIVIVLDGPIKFNINEIIKGNNIEHDVVQLEKNVGLAKALNIGLEYVRNELIFRVDTDDVLIFNRFEIQYSFMKNNPEISMLGGQINFIDVNGDKLFFNKKVPLDDHSIRKIMLFKNPFNHPTVVYKKSAIDSIGGYENVQFYEDWFLWWKLSKLPNFRFANLSDVLVDYRIRSFAERMGFRFLKLEYLFYLKLYKNNFISYSQFLIAVFFKLPIKIMPIHIYVYAKKVYNKL